MIKNDVKKCINSQFRAIFQHGRSNENFEKNENYRKFGTLIYFRT